MDCSTCAGCPLIERCPKVMAAFPTKAEDAQMERERRAKLKAERSHPKPKAIPMYRPKKRALCSWQGEPKCTEEQYMKSRYCAYHSALMQRQRQQRKGKNGLVR